MLHSGQQDKEKTLASEAHTHPFPCTFRTPLKASPEHVTY